MSPTWTLAKTAFIFLMVKSVSPAPANGHPEPATPHQPINATAYLAVASAMFLILLLLCAIKLLYLQYRHSDAATMKLKRLQWLDQQPSPSASMERISSVSSFVKTGSPFFLGLLGSPTRELGGFEGDLVRAPRKLRKKRPSGRPGKDLVRMTVDWIKEPWPIQMIANLDLSPARRNSSIDEGKLPIQWPSTHAPSPLGTPKAAFDNPRCAPSGVPILRQSQVTLSILGTSLSRHTSAETAKCPRRSCLSADTCSTPRFYEDPPSLPAPCHTPDRRKSVFLDTSDVIGTPAFATSEVLIEGSDDSPWFSPVDLGPAPGHTFLENLESGSPMPLRFRLPSPLLPTRKKSGSSKTRSPLRSLIFSQNNATPPDLSPSESETPLFKENVPLKEEKPTPYNHIGLGRPSQSPIPLHQIDLEKEESDSPTLESMLDQLVQATSDWDDSLFVDDKFKHLISGVSKKDRLDSPVLEPPLGATHCELVRSLGDEDDGDHGIHSHPNPFLNAPYALRDRTRDLLFSIPEEEAISFSDVVVQTY